MALSAMALNAELWKLVHLFVASKGSHMEVVRDEHDRTRTRPLAGPASGVVAKAAAEGLFGWRLEACWRLEASANYATVFLTELPKAIENLGIAQNFFGEHPNGSIAAVVPVDPPTGTFTSQLRHDPMWRSVQIILRRAGGRYGTVALWRCNAGTPDIWWLSDTHGVRYKTGTSRLAALAEGLGAASLRALQELLVHKKATTGNAGIIMPISAHSNAGDLIQRTHLTLRLADHARHWSASPMQGRKRPKRVGRMPEHGIGTRPPGST